MRFVPIVCFCLFQKSNTYISLCNINRAVELSRSTIFSDEDIYSQSKYLHEL